MLSQKRGSETLHKPIPYVQQDAGCGWPITTLCLKKRPTFDLL